MNISEARRLELMEAPQDEEQRLEYEGGRFLVQAQEFRVVDDATYERSIDLIKSGKAFIGSVEDFMNPHIKRAHEAHKALTGDRKRLIDPVKQAIAMYNERGQEYHAEIVRAQAIEQARINAEAKAAEEEARKRAEDRIIEAAVKAEERGEKELAKALVEELIVYKPPPPSPLPVQTMPKVKGVRYETRWIAELTEPDKVESNLLLQDKVRAELESAAQKIAQKSSGMIDVPGFKITSYKKQVTRK